MPRVTRNGMRNLWTLSGLSWRELALRTWRKSWEDAVFGQAARLAFYHFLAAFPALLLFLVLIDRARLEGLAVFSTLFDTLRQILPVQAFQLVQAVAGQMKGVAGTGIGIISAVLSAGWASVNASWALMTALNTAYEVSEHRPLRKVIPIAFVLTLSIGIMLLLALAAVLFGGHLVRLAGAGPGVQVILLRGIQWAVIEALLLSSFALMYRFAPDLNDREWQWSTPGAILASGLWILTTVLTRLYFEHFHSYDVMYQQLRGVAMLLIWLYLTSSAILIGGEMNSEIEKAAKRR